MPVSPGETRKQPFEITIQITKGYAPAPRTITSKLAASSAGGILAACRMRLRIEQVRAVVMERVCVCEKSVKVTGITWVLIVCDAATNSVPPSELAVDPAIFYGLRRSTANVTICGYKDLEAAWAQNFRALCTIE